MAYTRNWNISDPADTDQAKYGAQEIREFKEDTKERFESIFTGIDVYPLTPDFTKFQNFPSGTKMVFFQESAPTGWTQDTTYNDKALRVVSGTGGGSGGSRALSASTVGNHTLTVNEIPSHSHTLTVPVDRNHSRGETGSELWWGATTGSTDSTGGGQAHNHPLSLAYIDVIVCTKD